MTPQERKVIGMLPPGATLRAGPDGTLSDTPLWALWVRLAHHHADEAARERLPDDRIDQIALALGTGGTLPADDQHDGGEDYRATGAAMVALVAAAHAIDGFYGMVTDLVPKVRTRSRPTRHAIIAETLKRGFDIGATGHRWVRDLKWLFDARDQAVHHKTDLRPVVVVRETTKTVVVGAPEVAAFTPANARRAADLALEIPLLCLVSPRPETQPVAERYDYLTAQDLRGR